ncbi:hypothetical protein [Peribacillus asahii]|uniref:hypothetical protein n=1 Tax=Peribacillus asahii TaxID=228899 RepID=UPI00207AF4DF|nr:hypothetical protein [Peribacillus asahii]USK85715.1 hypothetical protein LIT35_03350 [Peribacillus asahii]
MGEPCLGCGEGFMSDIDIPLTRTISPRGIEVQVINVPSKPCSNDDCEYVLTTMGMLFNLTDIEKKLEKEDPLPSVVDYRDYYKG